MNRLQSVEVCIGHLNADDVFRGTVVNLHRMCGRALISFRLPVRDTKDTQVTLPIDEPREIFWRNGRFLIETKLTHRVRNPWRGIGLRTGGRRNYVLRSPPSPF